MFQDRAQTKTKKRILNTATIYISNRIADMRSTAKYILLLLTFITNYNALPYDLTRDTRDIEGALRNQERAPVATVSHNVRTDDCLINSERLEDCQEELRDNQLPLKVIICLNSCANCVKQWRAGVYNGRICALDCIQQVENLTETLDPDCNLMKYFNSTVLTNTS